MAARLPDEGAATQQDWVHLYAAGWLGLQQSRPLRDEAGRGQGHDYRTACHGRRPRSENGARLRPHRQWGQCPKPLCHVEGYAVRTPHDSDALKGLRLGDASRHLIIAEKGAAMIKAAARQKMVAYDQDEREGWRGLWQRATLPL